MSNDYTFQSDNPFEEAPADNNNPFEDDQQQQQPAPPPKPSKRTQTQVVQEEQQQTQPPVPAKKTNKRKSTRRGGESETQEERIERLQQLEADLNRREANLDQRQEILVEREKDQIDPRAANWPFFYPLVFQNIEHDAKTPELGRLMRLGYIVWMAAAGAYIWNFICALSTLIVTGSGIGDFILSIIYMVLFIPIDFFFYRILYRAGRKPKAITFVFFWIFWWPFVILGYFFFGVGFFGGMGLYQIAFDGLFDENVGVGVMVTICMVWWWLLGFAALGIFILSRLEYRKVGGTAAAKKQAVSEAVDQASKHPELIEAAAKEAAKNPDLIVKGAKVVASNKS